MSEQYDPNAYDFYEAPRMSWPMWLLVVSAGLGAIGYGIHLGDYVIAATAGMVLVSALIGFRMGLTRMGASLAAATGAVYFAPQLGMAYQYEFSQWFGTTGLLNRCVAIGAIGLVITLLGSLILSMIASRILRTRPRASWMNCWLGFGLGGVQGAIAMLLLLGGLLTIEPSQVQLANQDANASDQTRPLTSQKMTKTVLFVTNETHESRLGDTIKQFNPFQHFEPLKKLEQVQKSVQMLSDPKKIDELMHHPAINELQQQPEIKQAVANLMDDPEIREVLQSGESIDMNKAMKLLSHPAVMDLIDQPGFVEEASKIIEQSGRELNIQI